MAKKCLGEINGLDNKSVPSFSQRGENFSDSGDSGGCETFDYTDSDDNVERDTDWCEQKIKIDKRRIDMFVNENQKNCVEYLNEVMTSCRVRINGAAGLRNGLRLKKDPILKISGRMADVERAKSAIYDKLSPRGGPGSKVVLKIDIGHMEHSHIIGKSGNSIKAVMEKTKCHIHFPDSNRTNTEEKSNQVSISGEIHNVEQAREILRNMQQVELSFELPLAAIINTASPAIPGQSRPPFSPTGTGAGSSTGLADISNPVVQKIGQKYEINISVERAIANRPYDDGVYDTPPPVVLCTTKGSVSNLEKVKAGTRELIDYLTQNCTFPIVVTSTMDVSPQHQNFVFGKDRFQVQRIINTAGCFVGVPQFLNGDQPLTPRQKAIVYIVGNIDNVIAARQLLVGQLPVIFMFDVNGDITREQQRLEELGNRFDSTVNVKFRPKQQTSNIVIKTHERNVAACYEIRRLCGFDQEPNPCGEPTIIPTFGNRPNLGSTENLPSGRNTKTVPPAPRFHHETNNLLQMKNNAASAFASHSDSNNAAARVNAAAAMQSQLYQQILLGSILQSQSANLLVNPQPLGSSSPNPNMPLPSGSSSPNPAAAHSPLYLEGVSQLEMAPVANMALNHEDLLLRQLSGLHGVMPVGIPQPMIDVNSNAMQAQFSNSCSPQEHYSPPIPEPFKSHYHNVSINNFKNSLPPRLHKSRQNRHREASREKSSMSVNLSGGKSHSHLQAPTEHSGDDRNSISSDNASGSPNDKGNDVNMDSVLVNNNSTNSNNNRTNQSLTRQRSVENFGQSKTRLLTTNENAMPSACLVGARKKTNSGMTTYADCAKRLAIVTNQSAVSVDCNTKNYQGSFNASLNLNNNNSVADLLMLSQNNSSSSPSINQQPLSSSIDSVIAKTDSVIAKTASAVDLRMDSNNNNSPFLPGDSTDKNNHSPLVRQNNGGDMSSPANFRAPAVAMSTVCSSSNNSTASSSNLTITSDTSSVALNSTTVTSQIGSLNFGDSNSRQVLHDSAFFTAFVSFRTEGFGSHRSRVRTPLLEQDRKRLAAQSAIEQDVGSRPEVRVPNLGWAGLGFSRSMPSNSLNTLGLGTGRSTTSNLLRDRIKEDEEFSPSLVSPGSRDWNHQDDEVHPSDQRQRISKHGAPGDRPLPTPGSATSVTSSSPFNAASTHRPLMAARNTFAASNQVDVLSKLYKRASVPTSFTFDLQINDSDNGPSGLVSSSSILRGVGSGHGVASKETVTEVLTNSGLAKYIELFREQEISDMETFLSLTESDLRNLGITFGARRKLELEIKSRKMGRLQPVQEQVSASQVWYA